MNTNCPLLRASPYCSALALGSVQISFCFMSSKRCGKLDLNEGFRLDSQSQGEPWAIISFFSHSKEVIKTEVQVCLDQQKPSGQKQFQFSGVLLAQMGYPWRKGQMNIRNATNIYHFSGMFFLTLSLPSFLFFKFAVCFVCLVYFLR